MIFCCFSFQAQRFCSNKPRPDWHDAWQTFFTEVADLSTQINVIQSTFTKALFGMAGLTILFVGMEYQARTGIQMDMEVT